MPLIRLKDDKKANRPEETMDVLGCPSPVLTSRYQLSNSDAIQAKALFEAWGRGSKSSEEVALELWCLASQLNEREGDRYTAAKVRKFLDGSGVKTQKQFARELKAWFERVSKALIDEITAESADQEDEGAAGNPTSGGEG